MNCELNKYVYDCEECEFCEGERKMTNAEKYREEIENYRNENFCNDFVRPTIIKRDTCEGMGCVQCRMIQMLWLTEEYEEPEEPKVDWSKVAVDTPILVRDHEDEAWLKRYFAKFENNYVYAWDAGYTSWTADGRMMDWEYAKLAEEGDM